MSKTLLDISDDVLALEAILTDVEGDITDVEETVDAWLLENEANIHAKLDGYGALIMELLAREEFRKKEAARLLEIAKVDGNAAKRLKDRLRFFFEIHKHKKIETERYKFTLCKNGGPEVLQCDHEDATDLPAKYQKEVITYKQNSDRIRHDLANDVALDFARIIPRGSHIRVK